MNSEKKKKVEKKISRYCKLQYIHVFQERCIKDGVHV